MDLKFRAVEGRLVPVFESVVAQGAMRRYVGLKLNFETKKYEDVDTAVQRGSPAAFKYARLVRQGDLAPANESTAAVCGVLFGKALEAEEAKLETIRDKRLAVRKAEEAPNPPSEAAPEILEAEAPEAAPETPAPQGHSKKGKR